MFKPGGYVGLFFWAPGNQENPENPETLHPESMFSLINNDRGSGLSDHGTQVVGTIGCVPGVGDLWHVPGPSDGNDFTDLDFSKVIDTHQVLCVWMGFAGCGLEREHLVWVFDQRL
jgi:hypothetical protein